MVKGCLSLSLVLCQQQYHPAVQAAAQGSRSGWLLRQATTCSDTKRGGGTGEVVERKVCPFYWHFKVQLDGADHKIASLLQLHLYSFLFRPQFVKCLLQQVREKTHNIRRHLVFYPIYWNSWSLACKYCCCFTFSIYQIGAAANGNWKTVAGIVYFGTTMYRYVLKRYTEGVFLSRSLIQNRCGWKATSEEPEKDAKIKSLIKIYIKPLALFAWNLHKIQLPSMYLTAA